MTIHSTYTADCAIDRSIEHIEITHIFASASDINFLFTESDGSVDVSDDQGRKCTEYWGIREGSFWRVYAHRPMADDAV